MTAAARIAPAIAKNFAESILVRVKDKEGGTFKGLEIHREQRERRVPGLASLAPSSPYICFWAPLMERNFSIHEEVIYQTVAPESSE